MQVGAAAVGGGALFAVTGGLAAPAIAAGMGSILGFIGAPTALAGTVTGFLASTAGAATVTTTMAASGAASTGSRMAYRVAEISEFGFRELLPREPGPGGALTPAATSAGGQPGSQPPSRQHSAHLPPAGSADLQRQESAAGGKGGGDPGGDPGHLHLMAAAGGAGCYRSARAQALRRPGSASSLGSAASGALDSGSGSGPAWGSSGGGDLAQAAAAAEAQAAAQQLEQQPSVWQRWFGSTPKKDEYLLLPVPMRSR